MSAQKLPIYSWLNFKEKQPMKQFMRESTNTSRRIWQKVFEKKFQIKIEIGEKNEANLNDRLKNDTKLLGVFDFCNIDYVLHKIYSFYVRI